MNLKKVTQRYQEHLRLEAMIRNKQNSSKLLHQDIKKINSEVLGIQNFIKDKQYYFYSFLAKNLWPDNL